MYTHYFNFRENFRHMLTRSHREEEYFPILDGLRAIAILWVIGFHGVHFLGHFNITHFNTTLQHPFFSWLHWGFFGVDIFFVISGFLIGYLLMTEWKTHRHIAWKHFYYRRALRLLPAYYVTLVIYMIVFQKNNEHCWTNLLYINNLLPLAEQCMPWAWSLAIEEQFYLIFPFALLALLRLSPTTQWLALALLLCLAIVIRIAIYAYYDIGIPALHHAIDRDSYYLYIDNLYTNITVRYGALLLGVIAAYLYCFTSVIDYLKHHKYIAKCALYTAYICLIPAVTGIDTPHTGNAPPSLYNYLILTCYPYLFALTIAYILLYMTAHTDSYIAKFFASPIWYPIAQLSYSAYLTHPMIILIAYKILYTLPNTPSTTTFITTTLITLLAITAAAALLHLCIEQPFMQMRQRKERKLMMG